MRSLIVTPVVFLLALITVLGHAGEQKKGNKSKASKLVGKYWITSGFRNGKKIPQARLRDVYVRIGKNAITTFDRSKKEVYAATYKLDTKQKPWRISMTATITPVNGKGTKSRGLIEKKGNIVRLIYALPGGETPTKFKAGKKQQMFILKTTRK